MNAHLFFICLILYLLRFCSFQILGSSTDSPEYDDQNYNDTDRTKVKPVTSSSSSSWWYSGGGGDGNGGNDGNGGDGENNENFDDNSDKNYKANQDEIIGENVDQDNPVNSNQNSGDPNNNLKKNSNKNSDDNPIKKSKENNFNIDENTEENIKTVSKYCPENSKECLGCYNDWSYLNRHHLMCNSDIVATVQFKKSKLLTCGELIIEKAVKGIDGNYNSQFSMPPRCQNCQKMRDKTVCLITSFESYDQNSGFNLGSESYVVEGVCPNITCDTLKRSVTEDIVNNEDSVEGSIEKKSIVVENNNVTQTALNRESSALPESKNQDQTKDEDRNNIPIKGGVYGHSNGSQPIAGQSGFQSKHGYRSQPYYYDQMQTYGGLQRYGTSSVGYAQPPYGYGSGNRQQSSGYANSYGPKSVNQSSYGGPSYNSPHGQYSPIYPQIPAYSVRSIGYGTNHGPSNYNVSIPGSYGQQLYSRGQLPYNDVRYGRQIIKNAQSSGHGGQQSSSYGNNYGSIEGNQSRYGRSSQDEALNYGQQSSDNNEGYAQQSLANGDTYGTAEYKNKSSGTSYIGSSENYKQSIGNQQSSEFGGYGQYPGYANQQAIGYRLNNRPFEYANQPMNFSYHNLSYGLPSSGYNSQIQGYGQSSGYSGFNYNSPYGLPLGGYNPQNSSFGQSSGYGGSNYNSSYGLPSVGYNQNAPGFGQSSGYGGVYGQQTLGYNQQSSGYGDSNGSYGYGNQIRYGEPSASYGPLQSDYKQTSGYGQQYGSQQPSDYNRQQYGQQYDQQYDQQYGQQPSGYSGQQYGQQPSGYSGQQYGQQPSGYSGQQYGQQLSGYNGQQYGQKLSDNNVQQYSQQPPDYSNNYGSVGYGNQPVYGGSPYNSPYTQQPYGQQMPVYEQTSNYGSQPALGYENKSITGYDNFMPGYNSSYGESLEAYRQPFTNFGKLIKTVYNGGYGQPPSAYGTPEAFARFGRNVSAGYEHQSYTPRPVRPQYNRPSTDYYASSSNKLSVNISSCPNILNSCPKCISHLNLDLVYKICLFDSIIISSFNNSNDRSHENTLNQQNTNVFCDKSLLHQVYKSSLKIDHLFQFAINNKCKCTNIHKDIQSKVIIFSKSSSWKSASITLDENVNIVRHSYMNQYDTERLLKRCAKV